jgi:DNA mismatch repair ATPase MutS
MFFRRKKRILEQLESSFGKLKTEGFNFDLIKRYFLNKDNSNVNQLLSDQTCEDLDFDLFFSFVDRTSSRIGQQYLYSELRTINYSKDKSNLRENAIQFFIQHPNERLKVQYQLQKLNSHQSFYCADLFLQEPDKKPQWYYLIPLLSFGAVASLFLTLFIPMFGLIFFGFFAINLMFHYGFKRKTTLFINSVPTLLSLGAVSKSLYKYDHLQVIDPKLQSSLTTISSIRRKMSFFRLEQKVDSDMEAAYWFLLELIKIVFLLEPLLLFSSLEVFRNKTKDIENAYRFVGEVDMIISIASLRHGLANYCLPEISNQNYRVYFEDLLHPLVPNCVANTVTSKKSILLTGSNMSGKTTLIRAIGLNIISGITLNTCYASSAKFSNSKLFSVIRIEDDLTNSSSYFFQEVNAIKNIIEQAMEETSSIILLDELFKGTNTVERIASAKAILSFLAKHNCQIFVSTHDIELTSMLQQEFELFHFSETVEGSKIEFDYKMKSGIPENGNAIRILEINGFPESIVTEAKNLALKIK